VAGFWAWKNLGRSVNAGAKGIRILAPIVGVRRKKDEDAEKDITQQNTRTVLGFRNTYVFDISQTNGVDLPPRPQRQQPDVTNLVVKLEGITGVVTLRILFEES